MSYIGKIGISRLDPENLCDFPQAEQMLKEKVDPTIIKIKTGWECGVDGLWRYEIQEIYVLDISCLKKKDEEPFVPRHKMYMTICKS